MEALAERALQRGKALLTTRGPAAAAVAVVLAALLAVGLGRVRVIDDMSALLALDPVLQREDREVGVRVGQGDPGRFAVIVGDDENALLRNLQEAHKELKRAQEDSMLDAFPPVAMLLIPAAQQEETRRRAAAEVPALRAALAEQGFAPERFSAYCESLQHAEPHTLTPTQVLASPLAQLVRPFVLQINKRPAVVLPLRGVHDLHRLAVAVPHAMILDQSALLNETYAHVRNRIFLLLGLGAFVVMATVWMRYRKCRAVLVAVLPAVAAVVATSAVFGFAATPLTILHGMGFALVLSMGVDYGIFVVEALEDEQDVARAVVSIFVATLTTLLSFGLLALSSSPALRALGLSISLGLLFSMVLCPITWIIFRRKT
jgi:predicted exporter